MSFRERAGPNALRGFALGLVVSGVLAVWMLAETLAGNVEPAPGMGIRIVIIVAAGSAWGAVLGVCVTRPEGDAALPRMLLVLTAAATALPVPFTLSAMLEAVGQGPGGNLEDILCFTGLCALVAGMIAGIRHFPEFLGEERENQQDTSQKDDSDQEV